MEINTSKVKSGLLTELPTPHPTCPQKSSSHIVNCCIYAWVGNFCLKELKNSTYTVLRIRNLFLYYKMSESPGETLNCKRLSLSQPRLISSEQNIFNKQWWRLWRVSKSRGSLEGIWLLEERDHWIIASAHGTWSTMSKITFNKFQKIEIIQSALPDDSGMNIEIKTG